MPAVRIRRHAAGRSAEHTQHRRLVIGPGRLRQQIEVALNEARDRRTSSGRVALSAPNHCFVHAERQLWHIRIIARHSYVSGRFVTTITHLHTGFKGTMNALFLKDLAEKTHRGLRGRIEDRKSAGGLCYGYRVVKALNGTVTTGEREIDPAEAAVVERIFREFVAGVAPKAIAKRLNRGGIAGPLAGAGVRARFTATRGAEPES